TRDGYTFKSWTENGTAITQIVKGTTGNKTLVAQWNDCGAGNWCANGGSTVASRTYTIEDAFTLPATTRDGHTFNGWTENGTAIKQIVKGTTGNKTLVAQWNECTAGYYCPGDNTERKCPEGSSAPAGSSNLKQCTAGPKECTAYFAIRAYHYWDYDKSTYGKCIIEECEYGYHIEANACIPDEQPCDVLNGTGIKTWNDTTKKYDDCIATTCKPGYQINSERCVPCDNMYVNDEIAVSTYAHECEIATCLYQGEKYILENNECVPICESAQDETGRREWDENSKRCVHTCNDGWIAW
ncbi:MAG: InlB B-repeat-containing protein, partial [Alphaproteobacteria bacterium]